MPRRARLLLLLPAFALLAACATPRDRCVTRATADLRVIESLIAETEGNLARGFALVTEPTIRTAVVWCLEDDILTLCTRHEPDTRQRPVAIDTAAERRKLADLQARRAALQAPTRAALAACDAQFPAP